MRGCNRFDVCRAGTNTASKTKAAGSRFRRRRMVIPTCKGSGLTRRSLLWSVRHNMRASSPSPMPKPPFSKESSSGSQGRGRPIRRPSSARVGVRRRWRLQCLVYRSWFELTRVDGVKRTSLVIDPPTERFRRTLRKRANASRRFFVISITMTV